MKPALRSFKWADVVKIFKIIGYGSGAKYAKYGKKVSLTYESNSVLSRLTRTHDKDEDIGFVLHPALKKRIQDVLASTTNTKRHQVLFRNLLFFGPPGTGKTSVAREIARKSHMDYAIVSGGHVASLGLEATSEIHKLFDKAKRSKKGLLLVIDDADLFLSERKCPTMTVHQRSAINAVLFRAANLSQNVVLLLATNCPEELDPAVINQIDETVEFSLPGERERYEILSVYLEKGGIDTKLGENVLADAAKRTEGFSGRQLAILVASIVVTGGPDLYLGSERFEELLELKISEHYKKLFVKSDDP